MQTDSLKISVIANNISIPSMPMHLDDILAYAIVQKHIKGNKKKNDIINYEQLINQLPLGKLESKTDKNEFVWQASMFNWGSSQGKFMRPVSSRINKSQFAVNRASGVLNVKMNQLNLVSGPLKSSIGLMPMASEIIGTAYCLGNKKEIKELLEFVTNLGKKHNRGHGFVREWTVEIVSEQESEGWKNRTFPLSLKSFATESHCLVNDIGIRPPYWINTHAIAYTIA